MLLLFWNVTLSELRMHFVKSVCFFHFVCKFNNGATFYEQLVCETVYENTTAATVHVASTCDYETSVFYLDDVVRYYVIWMCMLKDSEQYMWDL